VFGVGGSGGRDVDGGGRAQETPAEDHCAECEPAEAERESSDDVGEPVVVEKDAAAADGGGDRDG
jgi:hypothetical protein